MTLPSGFYPATPELLSFPCHDFLRDLAKFANFVVLFHRSLTANEEFVDAAFHGKQRDNPESQKFKAENAFNENRELILELGLCRTVDNYLNYISDLLTLIFQKRPETLRSNEKISLEAVLEHDNFGSLLHSIAERKVYELSYRGLDDLSKFLFERHGFSLFENAEESRKCCRLVEYRNLIVHNRGVVNSIFAKRVTDCDIPVGKRLDFEQPFLDALSAFSHSVIDIDSRAAAKFGLDRVHRNDLMTHALS